MKKNLLKKINFIIINIYDKTDDLYWCILFDSTNCQLPI